MKLFKVILSPYDYDDYDGAVIIAESKEQVLELIENDTWSYANSVTDCYFVNHGQDIEIIEIDINEIKEPTLLLSSYNAG